MKSKTKRVKVKGHYRTVERDSKGKFVKVEKWSSNLKHDFESKSRIAKTIEQKFPSSEVGFFHNGIHYVLKNGRCGASP